MYDTMDDTLATIPAPGPQRPAQWPTLHQRRSKATPPLMTNLDHHLEHTKVAAYLLCRPNGASVAPAVAERDTACFDPTMIAMRCKPQCAPSVATRELK